MLFHWLSALAIFVLFPLGLWMTGLTYYDSWYKLAPDLHKSIGISLFGVLLVRVAWRFWDPTPAPVPGHKRWERNAAHAAHLVLYILIFAVMFSGYLISTADGRAISVFGLFDVPATITTIAKQEDVAGTLHFWLAITLIGTVVVHGAAALKHHYWDRDNTLIRMLGRR
ncbi:cytochrome b [Magnetovibrio blakemorei]|uniref:Cytochrome b n=1 Tax=Magnetovibrio blakemorei TaxID=28181 RepID=A0A1E5Q7F4_9PROT|nr:cytochrome b [Magnetovibrio blakemorei]OEJ66569.1 cytochrome b [Magnetovibrio blakemorei]